MDKKANQKWDVFDRYGNKIYLTHERWKHALEKRPWLAEYHNEVLTTLKQGRRKQDTLKPNKYKYYWQCDDLLPDFNHLVVIVLFGQKITESGDIISNNYVVNVWAVFIYGRR